jgi:hypothetical protein
VSEYVTLGYLLKKPEAVSIHLLDLNGRLVSVLFYGLQTEGEHLETYSLPSTLPGGTYCIRLFSSGVTSTAKIVR